MTGRGVHPETRINQERVKELFDYNPDTGNLIRKVRTSRNTHIGDIAGSDDSQGYLRIYIDGKSYSNHRLIWLYVYGVFSENFIDHKNRKTSDNRLKNLREVSRTCNARNAENRIDNTSGVKGVCWHKYHKKWSVQITVNKKHHLGYYKSFHNAVCARLAAEQCIDWSRCDLNSSAYQYVQNMLGRGM